MRGVLPQRRLGSAVRTHDHFSFAQVQHKGVPMRRSGLNAVAVPLACLFAAHLVAGCAATPSRRPLKTTAINTGEGSPEAVRKQLEGTWSLTSFSVFDTAGKPTVVDASGRLAYDAYGNLDLSGKINDPAAAGGSASALNFKGRAVVDAGGEPDRARRCRGQRGPVGAAEEHGHRQGPVLRVRGRHAVARDPRRHAGARAHRLEESPLVRSATSPRPERARLAARVPGAQQPSEAVVAHASSSRHPSCPLPLSAS